MNSRAQLRKNKMNAERLCLVVAVTAPFAAVHDSQDCPAFVEKP
jgi:hypothetical protein